MRWFRKRGKGSEAAKRAVEESQEAVQDAEERGHLAEQLTDKLREYREANHFDQMLLNTFKPGR